MARDDLTEADIVVLERQFPGLARLAAAARPGLDYETTTDGVRPLHPALGDAEPVDNR
jgi:hypothetical protein